MASVSLKRPLELDMPPSHAGTNGAPGSEPSCSNQGASMMAASLVASNNSQFAATPYSTNIFKRRCNRFSPNNNLQQQQQQQHHLQTPFKESSTLLNPLSDHIAASIKEEIVKANHTSQHNQHNYQHNHQHHHQHHQHLQQQQHKTNDPIMFTLAQTQTICERIIKEREQRLREEYDQILHKQLAEQYETFVRYTQDNIKKMYHDSSTQLSYLS